MRQTYMLETVRLAGGVLKEIEDRSPVIIERDDLAVNRQAAQRLDNVRESLVQDFLVSRIERDRAIGFHRDRSIAIQLGRVAFGVMWRWGCRFGLEDPQTLPNTT
jgi:hypothetical protein